MTLAGKPYATDWPCQYAMLLRSANPGLHIPRTRTKIYAFSDRQRFAQITHALHSQKLGCLVGILYPIYPMPGPEHHQDRVLVRLLLYNMLLMALFVAGPYTCWLDVLGHRANAGLHGLCCHTVQGDTLDRGRLEG
jgi:hypothetical protein